MSEQERTERATPKKRATERSKGFVARSQDVVAATSLVVAVVILRATATSDAAAAAEYMRSAFSGFEINALEFPFIRQATEIVFFLFKKLGLLFVMLAFASAVANILQTGFLYLPKKALPSFKRLNPLKNLKNLFSIRSALQACAGIFKAVAFALLIAVALKRDVETLISASFSAPVEIAAFCLKFVARAAYQFCALAVVFAVADYALRRWKYERDIRMTRQELLDEMKEETGSPQTKGRRGETRRTLMNSVDAVGGAAPAFPVSSFRSKQAPQKNDKSEKDAGR